MVLDARRRWAARGAPGQHGEDLQEGARADIHSGRRALTTRTAVVVLALLVVSAGCGGEEYYFWHRVAGRTIGPFTSRETCETIRNDVGTRETTTGCWRGR